MKRRLLAILLTISCHAHSMWLPAAVEVSAEGLAFLGIAALQILRSNDPILSFIPSANNSIQESTEAKEPLYELNDADPRPTPDDTTPNNQPSPEMPEPEKPNDEDEPKWDMPKEGKEIDGRFYTRHALERMAPKTPEIEAELSSRAIENGIVDGQQINSYVQPRGVPPSVVENTIESTEPQPGKYPFTWDHITDNVSATVNEFGDVVTVWTK